MTIASVFLKTIQLKDLFQFLKMMNHVRWLYVRINAQMVYKYGVQTGIHGAGNISIQVITNHNAVVGICAAALHRKFKNLFGRF